VKKVLDDGATVEDKFPKHRIRGKQKQIKQLIPAEDALRMMEGVAQGAADNERAAGDRRLRGLHDLANQAMDQKQREIDKVQRKADRQVRRAAKAVVAARAKRKMRPESFASAITRHVNSGGRPPRRRGSRGIHLNSKGQQILDTSSDE
jgi:hypothetical protein